MLLRHLDLNIYEEEKVTVFFFFRSENASRRLLVGVPCVALCGAANFRTTVNVAKHVQAKMFFLANT